VCAGANAHSTLRTALRIAPVHSALAPWGAQSEAAGTLCVDVPRSFAPGRNRHCSFAIPVHLFQVNRAVAIWRPTLVGKSLGIDLPYPFRRADRCLFALSAKEHWTRTSVYSSLLYGRLCIRIGSRCGRGTETATETVWFWWLDTI
jgi:hypothetical protein